MCDSKHSCFQSPSERQLPTRVLDLSSDSSNKALVRLLVTSSERARYACLSHCWGKSPAMTKTTTNSLDAHTRGIKVPDLPQTFQDAIDIVRRLGIRYLWIDALCIIQDDDKDWERESSRMAGIYQNAYVTIAATASEDGTKGCYRHESPEHKVKTVSYTPKIGPSIQVHSQHPYIHFNLDVGNFIFADGDEAPLISRAWVFQERFLSPRILHFCTREIVFECRGGMLCQCGEKSSNMGFKQDLWDMLNSSHGLHPVRDNRGWWAVVRLYTRLGLTFHKDTLPALSGIARQVAASQPEKEYFAGLWRDAMPNALLWRSDNAGLAVNLGTTTNRSDAPRAPSWSWASVVSPISWLLPHSLGSKKVFANIEHVSCTYVGSDTFGRVQNGVLRVNGPLLTMSMHWDIGGLDFTDQLWLSSDLPELDELMKDPLRPIYPDYDFHRHYTSPMSVLCLWISPMTILILRPTGEAGRFERIAISSVFPTDKTLDFQRIQDSPRCKVGTIDIV